MARITVAMSTPAPCAASYTLSCISGRHSLSTTLAQSATVCGALAGAAQDWASACRDNVRHRCPLLVRGGCQLGP